MISTSWFAQEAKLFVVTLQLNAMKRIEIKMLYFLYFFKRNNNILLSVFYSTTKKKIVSTELILKYFIWLIW